MIRRSVLKAGLALALLVGGATAALAMADKPFVKMAIRANMLEIALGDLAASKGSTDAVRSFGAQLKTDHTAANEKALALAATLRVAPPATVAKSQQKEIDKLNGLSGVDFDNEFLRFTFRFHRRQVQLFTEQTKLSTGDLAAFASATLPTLQSHLKMARSMAPKGMRKRKEAPAPAPAAAAPAAPTTPPPADETSTGTTPGASGQ
jgi:putative membrane protein